MSWNCEVVKTCKLDLMHNTHTYGRLQRRGWLWQSAFCGMTYKIDLDISEFRDRLDGWTGTKDRWNFVRKGPESRTLSIQQMHKVSNG